MAARASLSAMPALAGLRSGSAAPSTSRLASRLRGFSTRAQLPGLAKPTCSFLLSKQQTVQLSRPDTGRSSFSTSSTQPTLFWHRAGGLKEVSHSGSPQYREWDYSQVLGTVRRLQDPELHGHIIDGQKMAIVDVREPKEYAQGHIPCALNVPFSVLAQVDSEEPESVRGEAFKSAVLKHIDQDDTETIRSWVFGGTVPSPSGFVDDVDVVVYCKSGQRSARAVELISRRLGNDMKPRLTVGNYKGSFDDWVSRGGEVERP